MRTALGQKQWWTPSWIGIRFAPLTTDMARLNRPSAKGQSRRFGPLLGRSDLPLKGNMRRQTDSIASANVELLIPVLITLGQFGRCFGGIETKMDDQVPLACFRRRWWRSWGM